MSVSASVASAPSAPPASAAAAPTVWSAVQPFVFGGLSGMAATTVIQPIDMVKVRIQLLGEGAKGKGVSPFAVARQLVAAHGISAFYTGLSAGLLRQATYTTARMGLFNTFMAALDDGGKKKVGFVEKAVAGLAAGGLGAVAGNPCDLALIRMQADGMAPAAARKNYSSVVNAIARISREEGILALWKGSGPTVVRAMALNLGMLSTYSEAKTRLEPVLGKNSSATALASSAVAGFFASFFSLPFDFLKTRLQKQVPDPSTGKMMYKGTLDCAVKVFEKEGPLAFYKGFGTYYVRIAPQ
ncbi:putative mitochondrial 2-oxoglutarate/malate carrier protein [Entophlyctis luteolus]|nr:putative mitochondrial 2-oxoglutarate/malate carrier protein [Entophlyctis luteolus]